MTADVRICKPGGRGLVLPLLSAEEQWPYALRGTVYGIAMVYGFLGMSLIADIFMDSITVITSRRRRVRLRSGEVQTQKVWNETVATLSLMALGSSAPEICLSMIEIVKRNMHVGGLGPSTIVGSAAFNLLVIIAVCMMSIPSDEVRRIQALPVFYVTAVFSVIAYLWIVFILTIVSVDVVEIWEAVVTLLMLPVLVWVSWKTDTGDLARAVGCLLGRPACGREERRGEEGVAEKGFITFTAGSMSLSRTTEEQTVKVQVVRSGDCKGSASCAYRTERFTAVPEYDYAGLEGDLEFDPGVSQASVELRVLPSAKGKAERIFFLVLEQADGARFSPDDDGGEESAILTVIIFPSADSGEAGRAGCAGFAGSLVNVDGVRLSMVDWGRQSISAMYCNGSREEQRTATFRDWAFHLVCLPFKILFLPVPPLSLFGGWPCFWGSLAMIAGLTAVLSDLAELFGCVVDVPDILTALTFVALGTSMPDLFASLSAARVDPTADASIVNVTGSNAVNVYLGLGLPWTVGAIYWTAVGRTPDWVGRYPAVANRWTDGAAFVVDSKNLGFSVVVFTLACLQALLLLHVRRKFIGAELGGPMIPKAACGLTFVLMWIGFCGIIGWRVMRWEKLVFSEELSVIGGAAALEVALGLVTVALTLRYGRTSRPEEEPEFGKRVSWSRPQFSGIRRSNSMGSQNSSSESPTRTLKSIRSSRIRRASTYSASAGSAPGSGSEQLDSTARPECRRGYSFPSSAGSTDVTCLAAVAEEMPSLEVNGMRLIKGASTGVTKNYLC